MVKHIFLVGLLLAAVPFQGNAAKTSPGQLTGADIVQQESACSGYVTDSNGEPIVGASVIVKGTKNGSLTDADGRFTIPGVKRGSVIAVSYVGFSTVERTWNGGQISITLTEDSKELNEVVVVGYGTQKKVNVTGAVSMVGAEAFKDRPVADVSHALQGVIPGLNLSTTSNGGLLNSSLAINIRGTGSIGNGSNDNPLILIDGIEGDLNSVNPNDIESVSVLKDAASASIYGSRAAFGVILVTTKSGKEGRVRVTYSGDIRFNTATQIPDMANSLEWATYFNAASRNAGGSNVFSDETMERIKKYMNGEYRDPSQPEYYGTVAGTDGKWMGYTGSFANTDWFHEFYKKNVASTQQNLSMSGGNENINWLFSVGYLQNNGLIRHGHDEMDRYNTNAKIGARLAPWARMDFNFKWTRNDYTQPQYMSGLFFHNIARRWPTCPVYDPNGHYLDGMEVAELEDGGTYNTKGDLFTQQLSFTFTPLTGWNIHADGALRIDNEKYTTSTFPVYHYTVNNEPYMRNSGYSTVTTYRDQRFREDYYALNLYTDYSRTFAEKHNMKVLLGVNYERYKQDNLSAYGENLTTQDKPYLSQTQTNPKVGDSYWNRATAGYFGRLNYDYDGIYMAEVNLRYDGSSRFVGNKRWAWFPSFSLGWNIAREQFFQNLTNEISTLKLRLSYGRLGNTNSYWSSFWDWYPFYQQQSIGNANSTWLINGQRQNTASLPSIINTSLTWEKIETWDVGLDWAAFNNRLTGSFDWYTRSTKDMIGPAPFLCSLLGADAPRTNNCNMRTNGWEFEVQWRDHIGEVGYNVRLNLSDATSKIKEYPYDGNFENQSINGYYNGKKLGEIWGYQTHGIAQSDEEMQEWLKTNKPNWGSNWGAGDIMYTNLVDRTDADGKKLDEGVVNAGSQTLGDHGDLKVIGNTTPRYRIGINLGAEWRGIDFSVFFQGVLKRDWAFGTGDPYFWGATGNMWQSAVFKEHLDYWSEDNKGAYYPKPYLSGGITKNQQYQTKYLQNAAYLRCKNIQIGYSLPHALISKVGMSNCRIYFSCDNLFTITSLSDVFDPEVISGMWGSGKTYPLQRTLSFGLNLSF